MTALDTPVTVRYAQRETWQADGACRGMDPRLFFPARGEISRPAQNVCHTCPVQPQCLDYALTNHETFGVWGGTTERERRRIRRRMGRPPAAGSRGPLKYPQGWLGHEHGTNGGYQAHHRYGTTPCPDCLHAHSQYRKHRAA